MIRNQAGLSDSWEVLGENISLSVSDTLLEGFLIRLIRLM